MTRFFETLRTQRWDDHRYYHHSLVNRSLHLLSAVSFLFAYGVMFHDIALAALIAWLIGMTSRQLGHFFFEPREYDAINQATDEYKEAIKIGYNIRRKLVLMTIWGLSPLLLIFDSRLPKLDWTIGAMTQVATHLGYIWLVVGVSGLLFRTIHLFIIRDYLIGLAWAAKILTDPFNDAKLYWQAPLLLLRRDVFDAALLPDHQHEVVELPK
jgi:hypothetical protein